VHKWRQSCASGKYNTACSVCRVHCSWKRCIEMARLPAQVGPRRLRWHYRHSHSVRKSLETRHRTLQQVGTVFSRQRKVTNVDVRKIRKRLRWERKQNAKTARTQRNMRWLYLPSTRLLVRSMQQVYFLYSLLATIILNFTNSANGTCTFIGGVGRIVC